MTNLFFIYKARVMYEHTVPKHNQQIADHKEY